MRRIVDNDHLTMAVRVVVGGVFVSASVYKIIDPGSFARSIWYYHVVPGSLINLLALVLPWVELAAGLGLMFGVLYRGAVVWVNFMTVAFIAAVTSAVARGLNIECGCFKAADDATGSAWQSLILDGALLLL
ncbi:MAG: DoxX family membrane protein, partial [candidate division Zixibacteria bacterium]|nr:DoxX family membrane protein [candidate division Zixibacteria bacterium]